MKTHEISKIVKWMIRNEGEANQDRREYIQREE